MITITPAILLQIAPHAGDAATLYAAPLTDACPRYSIDTPVRMAAFLAQVAEESGEFRAVEEDLNYSAARIMEVWPHRFNAVDALAFSHHPELLANHVYAGRLGNGPPENGDGWRYRGRGLIQLTGRALYAQCGDALSVELLRNPDLLTLPDNAVASACWYWLHRGCNAIADGNSDDAFAHLTLAINGGTTNLPARRTYWARAKAALGA